MGKDVYVDSHARIDASRENSSISIGDNTLVHEYSLIKANGGKISIGRDCTVNDYSILYGHGGLVIGNDVHIAAHVVIVPANHIYENPDIFISKQGETKKGIIIEDDVWLGANAVILDGVTIGRGSIVGAGAVVTRSVPPCVVVAGSPAKVIKKREFK
ncbi:MAG: hypothetical protein A2231_07140 [Candidatus Firestonebacteria bacterium RIFOXYA2_FULL_40_8]|nr:MAG: hypothetical protein A2231_07140 [Candidatus Firestonebacteria bacterium RIFOXYA2_FULL_40_8]